MVKCFLGWLMLAFALAGAWAYAQPPDATGLEAQGMQTAPSDVKALPAQDSMLVLEALQAQQKEMNQELRAIKREMAALKTAVQEPDFKDILGGIGYILGIFGVAYYVQARQKRGPKGS
ncbi:MAG: hypothetical protein ACUVSA_04480 [Desulfosoma sp.]|uniref:hypothetical protein n=1 Tax=Desulfosoma sp. TaxID=2603217 RepID=UPI00404AE775